MLSVEISHRQGAFSVECSFSSAQTGITALFGPSGSGKTSVVNMVAGLSRPDSGRILLNGRPLVDIKAGVCLPMDRRRIGYVFQDGRLFPHMTVRSNLTYGQNLIPADARSIKLDSVVELLGIGHLLDRRPARLSGGEKQRVAIGRALLSSPHLLLMDEPLAALDQNRKEEVLPFIARLPREFSIPILYVTHSMDEILRLADQLVLMEQGTSVASGPTEDLLNRADLRTLTGRYEPGTVIPAVITRHEHLYSMSYLDSPAGTLVVPQLEWPEGTPVRVRVLAREVSLSLHPPLQTSIQNVFTGIIESVTESEGPFVDLRLNAGSPLLSQVTRRSMIDLGLEVGMQVHAMVKAMSITRSMAMHQRPLPE